LFSELAERRAAKGAKGGGKKTPAKKAAGAAAASPAKPKQDVKKEPVVAADVASPGKQVSVNIILLG